MKRDGDNRRVLVASAAFGLCLSVIGACFASSQMGKAVVEDRDGVPCFRVKDESWLFKSKFKLDGISVIDAMLVRTSWDAPYVEAWGFNSSPEAEPVEVTSDDCLRYGILPPSMIERSAAERLQPGKLYSVSIGAKKLGGSVSTPGYRALFCLAKAADGRLVVRSPASKEQAMTPGPASCLQQ